MITVIFEKPKRTVDVNYYGVGSYVDKTTHKQVYTVYGYTNGTKDLRTMTVTTKKGEPLYVSTPTQNEVIIFRSDSEEEAGKVKDYIDLLVANSIPIFNMDMYKTYAKAQEQVPINDEPVEAEVVPSEN